MRLVVTLLLLAAAVHAARSSWSLPLLGDGERALYDLRFVAAADRTATQDDRITLVTYTDETLLALQKRSPLDRAILARALKVVDAMQPRAIGIDILFDQPQAEDDELIGVLRALRTPTFLAYTSLAANPDQMVYDQDQFLRDFIARARTPRVAPAAILLTTDAADGVMRRWPEREAGLPPLLANALAPERTGMATFTGAIDYRIPQSSELPVFGAIPIETLAAMADLPPDILAQAVADPLLRGQFAGRYVLIGADINDIDEKETPITRLSGQPMIGLEVHAQMLRQLLDGDARPGLPGWALWSVALLVVAAGAVTGALEVRGLYLAAALALQLGLIAALPFLMEGQDVGTLGLPAAGWGAGWLLAFLGLGIAARAVGAEQRRFAHSALGKYLPADVANEILRDPDRLTLTGEKKEIFALFTDLEGFTKLSHAIAPERLSLLLNAYLDRLSDIVLAHGGTIDKFVGDAVVAFWGAPIARADDGRRAAEAAVAMFEAGEAFRRDAGDDLPAIGRTRVGLHRGDAVVGNFGGDRRIQYTALGDGMNTAARLESANKALQTTILVSGAAKTASGLDFFRPMGRIVLSGRATPIEVWEPKADMDAAKRAALTALWLRFDGGERDALAGINALAAEDPDDAALALFAGRLRAAGPGGHYVLGSK